MLHYLGEIVHVVPGVVTAHSEKLEAVVSDSLTQFLVQSLLLAMVAVKCVSQHEENSPSLAEPEVEGVLMDHRQSRDDLVVRVPLLLSMAAVVEKSVDHGHSHSDQEMVPGHKQVPHPDDALSDFPWC